GLFASAARGFPEWHGPWLCAPRSGRECKPRSLALGAGCAPAISFAGDCAARARELPLANHLPARTLPATDSVLVAGPPRGSDTRAPGSPPGFRHTPCPDPPPPSSPVGGPSASPNCPTSLLPSSGPGDSRPALRGPWENRPDPAPAPRPLACNRVACRAS